MVSGSWHQYSEHNNYDTITGGWGYRGHDMDTTQPNACQKASTDLGVGCGRAVEHGGRRVRREPSETI